MHTFHEEPESGVYSCQEDALTTEVNGKDDMVKDSIFPKNGDENGLTQLPTKVADSGKNIHTPLRKIGGRNGVAHPMASGDRDSDVKHQSTVDKADEFTNEKVNGEADDSQSGEASQNTTIVVDFEEESDVEG